MIGGQAAAQCKTCALTPTRYSGATNPTSPLHDLLASIFESPSWRLGRGMASLKSSQHTKRGGTDSHREWRRENRNGSPSIDESRCDRPRAWGRKRNNHQRPRGCGWRPCSTRDVLSQKNPTTPVSQDEYIPWVRPCVLNDPGGQLYSKQVNRGRSPERGQNP